RRFFDAIMAQCQQAELVWGRELYVDATQVQADAAMDALIVRFAVEARAARAARAATTEVEAHLASLFPDADPRQRGVEEQGGPGGVSPAPGTEANEAAPPAPPRPPEPTPLPVALPEALRKEITAANAVRHDWIAAGRRQQREVHGYYQRTADFRISTTDPDGPQRRGHPSAPICPDQIGGQGGLLRPGPVPI